MAAVAGELTGALGRARHSSSDSRPSSKRSSVAEPRERGNRWQDGAPTPRGWPRGPVLPDVLTACSIALIAPSATGVLVVPVARPDPGEEDVRWAVFGLRRRQREGGGESATEPG